MYIVPFEKIILWYAKNKNKQKLNMTTPLLHVSLDGLEWRKMISKIK